MANGDPTTTPTVTPPAAPAAPDATPAPTDEGLLHSFATGWGVDPEAVKWAAKTIWNDPIGSAKAIGGAQVDELKHAFTHPIEAAKEVGEGVVSAVTPNPDAVKTAQAHLHAPGLVNKLVGGAEYLTSGVPLFGAAGVKAEEQGAKGNIPGMLGTTAAVASQVFAGGKAGEESPKLSKETKLGSVSPEAGKTPGELEPLNRANAKTLQDLGYSNQTITNLNATEVDHILKNNIPAPPRVDLTSEGAKEVMPAPHMHPPAEDVAATAAAAAEPADLQMGESRKIDVPKGRQGSDAQVIQKGGWLLPNGQNYVHPDLHMTHGESALDAGFSGLGVVNPSTGLDMPDALTARIQALRSGAIRSTLDRKGTTTLELFGITEESKPRLLDALAVAPPHKPVFIAHAGGRGAEFQNSNSTQQFSNPAEAIDWVDRQATVSSIQTGESKGPLAKLGIDTTTLKPPKGQGRRAFDRPEGEPATGAEETPTTGATSDKGILGRLGIDTTKLPPAPGQGSQAFDRPQGGHAGGGVASLEELNRPGRFVSVDRAGTTSDQGKTPDFNLRPGSVGYQVKPDGTHQLIDGQETPTHKAAIENYKQNVYPSPAPEHLNTLAKRGQLEGQRYNLGDIDGATYRGGLDQSPRPGSEDATDKLQMGERQSPLKEPYTVEVTDQDGTKHTETIEGFSSKNALAAAQKQFPNGYNWSLASGKSDGPRTLSTEYTPGTKKPLSMRASNTGRTARERRGHEVGHVMEAQAVGIKQLGIARSSHPDNRGDYDTFAIFSGEGVYVPGTRVIKPERRMDVVRLLVGGIARDEGAGLHRASNHNFSINLEGSDGHQAYSILTAADYTHENAMDRMNQLIDIAADHQSRPHVASVIEENLDTREEGLSRHYDYSPERLDNMWAESQRRAQNATEKRDAAGNGAGLAEGSPESLARGESGISKAIGPVSEGPDSGPEPGAKGELSQTPGAEKEDLTAGASKVAPTTGEEVIAKLEKPPIGFQDAKPIPYSSDAEFTNRTAPSMILPDGRIINARLAHTEIAAAAGFKDTGSSLDKTYVSGVTAFQRATGVVRVIYPEHGGNIGIEIHQRPSNDQLGIIGKNLKNATAAGKGDGSLTWDLADANGKFTSGHGSIGDFRRAVDTAYLEQGLSNRVNSAPVTKTPKLQAGEIKGDAVDKPAATYHEAAATEGNPWVRRSADPADDAAPTNKGRQVMVQFSSDLINKDLPSGTGGAYYDKLYGGARPGYARMQDTWEIPQWMGFASHALPKADVYFVRDMAQAKKFLNEAGYDRALFSALDVNTPLIKELAKGYKGAVDVGGYQKPGTFLDSPNVTYHASIQDMMNHPYYKGQGLEYKNGTDYRHFEGSDVIPRLTMSDGCLHKCAFCVVEKKIDVTPESVVDQQAESIAKLGAKLVYLNDKTFGQASNYQHLSDVYAKMKEANPAFHGFVVQTTAAQMGKIPSDWLQKSGIKYVELGIESYNDPILKEMHKPANQKLIDAATQKLRENGIALIPNILVGLPGETAQTYANTLKFLQDNKDIISHANIYNLALYENSELGKKLTTANPDDFNENVLEKSFHSDPAVHKQFAGDLYGAAQDMLDQPPPSATKTNEPATLQMGFAKQKAKAKDQAPKITDMTAEDLAFDKRHAEFAAPDAAAEEPVTPTRETIVAANADIKERQRIQDHLAKVDKRNQPAEAAAPEVARTATSQEAIANIVKNNEHDDYKVTPPGKAVARDAYGYLLADGSLVENADDTREYTHSQLADLLDWDDMRNANAIRTNGPDNIEVLHDAPTEQQRGEIARFVKEGGKDKLTWDFHKITDFDGYENFLRGSDSLYGGEDKPPLESGEGSLGDFLRAADKFYKKPEPVSGGASIGDRLQTGFAKTKKPAEAAAPEAALKFTHKTFGVDDSIARVSALDAKGEDVGHVTYGLPKPAKRTGDFSATIAMAAVDTPGQGLGQKLYLQAADAAKTKGARYLVSDVAHGVDPSAVRVWDALVAKGYPVEKLGAKNYRMDLSKFQTPSNAAPVQSIYEKKGAQELADHIGGRVVGSVATKGVSTHDLDLAVDTYDQPKIEAAMKARGFEPIGSSVVSPAEAKTSGKTFGGDSADWNRAHHFENNTTQSKASEPRRRVDIWSKEPAESDVIDHIKSGGQFGVLTAENPQNRTLSAKENATRNEALRQQLEARGHDPIQLTGHSDAVGPATENPFFVKDLPAAETAALGREHGQQSVLTHQGLHDLNKDVVNPLDPSQGIMTGPDAEKQKYFSKHDGQAFSAPVNWDKTVAPEGKGESLSGVPVVSTRVPHGTLNKVKFQRHEDTTRMSDMEAATAAPGYLQKMMDKVHDIPGFVAPQGGTIQEQTEAFIQHGLDNIMFVHSKMTPEKIALNKQWYPVGAHGRGIILAHQNGITPAQAYGITSVESPLTDWDQNTSLAERTASIYQQQQNTRFTPEMAKAADAILTIPAMAGFKKSFSLLRGKTLAELPDIEDKAYWLRIYDEAHNPREYMQWNADGTQAGIARSMDGTPRAVGWSFFTHIEKAIRIAQDGSPENISRQLGLNHKVRNFYNNQADPDNPRYLTIDTHAGAVAQLRPLSGGHPDIFHIFGNPSNNAFGLSGTYPLYDEMYRRAAKKLDEPIPSRVQSSVWAEIREVFNDDFKTPENLAAVDAIWKESTDGKITADEARNRIWDFATRWNREAAEKGRASDNQGKLFAPDVSGTPASGTPERGNGAGVAPPPAAEEVGDTSFDFGANVKPEAGSFGRAPKKSKAKTQLNAVDLLKALSNLKKPAR